MDDRLSSRNSKHESWQEAIQEGATHVRDRAVRDEIEHRLLESSLLLSYNPPMNTV